jgi:cell division protein FtsL
MKICRYICMHLIILIMTIFTISESSRTIKIGYNIARMEKELKKLSEENKKLEYKSDRLKVHEKVSLRVKDMKLNLIIPDEGKDIILVEKVREFKNKNPYGKS